LRALLLILMAGTLAAETTLNTNVNAWFIYQGQHAISPKWEVHLESHLRRHQLVTSWQQILLRGGLQRPLGKGWSAGGGYTFFRSYPWGDYPIPAITNEQRLHQQVNYRHKTGTWDWQHRIRFEERWIHDRGLWRYQHRLRQYVKTTVPFKKSPWYLGVSNELWFNLPPNVIRSYDQNRTVITLGRRVSPATRVELGYMYQPRLQRNGFILESNHTVVLYLLSNKRFRE
jgi:hypothetical protein